MKKMVIIALLCIGTALLSGCIAEETTKTGSAVNPETSPVPGKTETLLPVLNRTPGDYPPGTPPAILNMTEGERPQPPATGEGAIGGERSGPPGGMNRTQPGPGQAPGGMVPPATPAP